MIDNTPSARSPRDLDVLNSELVAWQKATNARSGGTSPPATPATYTQHASRDATTGNRCQVLDTRETTETAVVAESGRPVPHK